MYKKAVVLFSGGMDSTTCLGIALKNCDEVYPITFDYGQSNRKEIEVAKNAYEYYENEYPNKLMEHKIFDVSDTFRMIGGSALTDDDIELGDGDDEIPVSYVPARNTIFLSFGLAYGEANDCNKLYIGTNHMDYSGYSDCRPEYINKMQELFGLATKQAIEGEPIQIENPLQHMNKKEIVSKGNKINVPYEHTWSCYRDTELACGTCDSCELRLEAFDRVGIEDPITYE